MNIPVKKGEKVKKLSIEWYHQLKKEQLKTLVKRKPGAYIVNLQDSDQGNGSHWTAFYIYKNQWCYFDSYGQPAPPEVLVFCQNITQKSINFDAIQALQRDIFCGFYCIAFCFTCLINKEHTMLDDILVDFCAPFDLNEQRNNAKILQTMFKQMIKRKNTFQPKNIISL